MRNLTLEITAPSVALIKPHNTLPGGHLFSASHDLSVIAWDPPHNLRAKSAVEFKHVSVKQIGKGVLESTTKVLQ